MFPKGRLNRSTWSPSSVEQAGQVIERQLVGVGQLDGVEARVGRRAQLVRAAGRPPNRKWTLAEQRYGVTRRSRGGRGREAHEAAAGHELGHEDAPVGTDAQARAARGRSPAASGPCAPGCRRRRAHSASRARSPPPAGRRSGPPACRRGRAPRGSRSARRRSSRSPRRASALGLGEVAQADDALEAAVQVERLDALAGAVGDQQLRLRATVVHEHRVGRLEPQIVGRRRRRSSPATPPPACSGGPGGRRTRPRPTGSGRWPGPAKVRPVGWKAFSL